MENKIKYLVGTLLLFFCFICPVLAEEPKDIAVPTSAPPKIMIEPHTGMEFIWVEDGCYEMGCGDWQINCQENEKPAHDVCVDGFWIGKYEVTQGQWEKVMGSNPSDNLKNINNPVEYVSWEDTHVFIKKLNNLNIDKRVIVRLPTEAEWEYAARSGGKQQIYAGFNIINEGFWKKFKVGSPTVSVGSSKPNDLEIHDMSGNVFEWCEDWYSDKYYSNSPKQNPTGPEGGREKVVRSSASQQPEMSMRTTFRYGMDKDFTSYDIGFRLVGQFRSNDK